MHFLGFQEIIQLILHLLKKSFFSQFKSYHAIELVHNSTYISLYTVYACTEKPVDIFG